jgi:hypothetical protein
MCTGEEEGKGGEGTCEKRAGRLGPLVLEPRREVAKTLFPLCLASHNGLDGGVDGVDELIAFELERSWRSAEERKKREERR